MIVGEYRNKRKTLSKFLSADLVVIGGGMSGVCCAINAARNGIKVILVQDRPVLGGNASSEIRLWVLGATSHMGNNNRWSREGGVIDEILLENLYRNKEGNPILFDMVLMDKVKAETNITLLLNTVVYDITKKKVNEIAEIEAFNPQNATHYTIDGKLFADCSGDGIVAYLAGASFRMGSEDESAHGEKFTPDKKIYGELLGQTILFYTKETKKPVRFVAPDFALKDIEKVVPRISNPNYFNVTQQGCKYWWIEYGGRLDTVHDTENIKFELWKVVYGVWDYIKNSGKFPETVNQTLEWVGLFSGKRESRRFNGYYDLIQQDIVEQRAHYDDVAFGGWSIDLHPADAVYSSLSACNQWHSKGIYGIPYRCYLSREIDNLFLGGRLISASHVAHGSSRVMCTCAHGGQAIGMAAALSIKNKKMPAYYVQKDQIKVLQQELINTGQFIPEMDMRDPGNLVLNATIKSSSKLLLDSISYYQNLCQLSDSMALLFPVIDEVPDISVTVNAAEATELVVELRQSVKTQNFTPDETIKTFSFSLLEGENYITISPKIKVDQKRYLFLCFLKNKKVSIMMSNAVITGLTTVYNTINPAVSNWGKQTPPESIGVDEFEFWCPKRWPENKLVACKFTPALDDFDVDNLYNSFYRPVYGTNGWVASMDDENPELTLQWDKEQSISTLRLFFDSDFDQALENNQMGHYYSQVPQCVESFCIKDKLGKCIYATDKNHLSLTEINLKEPIVTSGLTIQFRRNKEGIPVSLMGIICF